MTWERLLLVLAAAALLALSGLLAHELSTSETGPVIAPTTDPCLTWPPPSKCIVPGYTVITPSGETVTHGP